MACSSCLNLKAELSGQKAFITEWFEIFHKQIQSIESKFEDVDRKSTEFREEILGKFDDLRSDVLKIAQKTAQNEGNTSQKEQGAPNELKQHENILDFGIASNYPSADSISPPITRVKLLGENQNGHRVSKATGDSPKCSAVAIVVEKALTPFVESEFTSNRDRIDADNDEIPFESLVSPSLITQTVSNLQQSGGLDTGLVNHRSSPRRSRKTEMKSEKRVVLQGKGQKCTTSSAKSVAKKAARTPFREPTDSPTSANASTCALCGKQLNLIQGKMTKIRVHARIHCEMKPYRCSICNMDFTRTHQAGEHIQRHHPSKSDVIVLNANKEEYSRQLDTKTAECFPQHKTVFPKRRHSGAFGLNSLLKRNSQNGT